jgi:hypothetical protein
MFLAHHDSCDKKYTGIHALSYVQRSKGSFNKTNLLYEELANTASQTVVPAYKCSLETVFQTKTTATVKQSQFYARKHLASNIEFFLPHNDKVVTNDKTKAKLNKGVSAYLKTILPQLLARGEKSTKKYMYWGGYSLLSH